MQTKFCFKADIALCLCLAIVCHIELQYYAIFLTVKFCTVNNVFIRESAVHCDVKCKHNRDRLKRLGPVSQSIKYLVLNQSKQNKNLDAVSHTTTKITLYAFSFLFLKLYSFFFALSLFFISSQFFHLRPAL